MTATETVCLTRCRLHTRPAVHLPCRHCEPSHVRLARPAVENAIRRRNPQRQIEGSDGSPDAAGGPSPERTAVAGARRSSALSKPFAEGSVLRGGNPPVAAAEPSAERLGVLERR